MKEKVLEDLALQCGCFISDLKMIRFRSRIRSSLLLSSDQYSVEELNYCLSYLLNKSFSFQSKQEIIQYIKTAFPIQ